MDKKIICSCPKCGKDVIEERYSYGCECGFKCNKEIWGIQISEDMIKDICNGKETEEYLFVKPDKQWQSRLKFSKEEGKVIFAFDNKVIGKCPACGGDVRETDKYFLCKNYKQSCNLIIGKDICGQNISKDEAIKLLSGEILEQKEFTWKSGKTGFAKLKINNDKTEFIFV